MLTGTNSLGIKGHLYSLWMLLKVVVEKVMDKEDKWVKLDELLLTPVSSNCCM